LPVNRPVMTIYKLVCLYEVGWYVTLCQSFFFLLLLLLWSSKYNSKEACCWGVVLTISRIFTLLGYPGSCAGSRGISGFFRLGGHFFFILGPQVLGWGVGWDKEGASVWFCGGLGSPCCGSKLGRTSDLTSEIIGVCCLGGVPLSHFFQKSRAFGVDLGEGEGIGAGGHESPLSSFSFVWLWMGGHTDSFDVELEVGLDGYKLGPCSGVTTFNLSIEINDCGFVE